MSETRDDERAGLSPAEMGLLGDGLEHTAEALCWAPSCDGSLPWAVERIVPDRLTAANARAEAAEARVAAGLALAGEWESWQWSAPVGPGNASYANGYTSSRRDGADRLRAALTGDLPERDEGRA